MTDNKGDILSVDYVTVPGQLYALVSFVSPEGRQKNDQMGMKLRGCFPNKVEADQHAKLLQKTDPAMDIFLMDMYKWVAIPPDRNNAGDEHFQEEFLQNLMSQYNESQENAKAMFNERVQTLKSGEATLDDLSESKYYTKPAPPQDEHPSQLLEKMKSEYPELSVEELVKKMQEQNENSTE